MKKKNKSLIIFLNNKLHTPKWLFLLLIITFILRIPFLFEPYSYGDEMIYLTLGHAINQGIPLYKGVHDNKPPLLYIMAAIAGNLFWFKAILTFWIITEIFIFWKLNETLFPKNTKAQKISTIIFAILTTIPLLEGNIVNAELFMIGLTITGFYILLSNSLTAKNIFFSGILLSTATLFKVPAAFDIPAIVFFWIAKNGLKKDGVKKIIRNTLILISGFIVPIGITFLWYFIRGSFNEYFNAAYLQNFGYLSSWRPSDVQRSFLVRNLPLLLRGGVALLLLTILFKIRKKVSQNFLFATSWLTLSLFAVTLSERPYPHYLIQSVPSISILLTILFTHENREQVLAIIPLTLAFFVPYHFKFWYYPTLPYYTRFIRLITNNISYEEYMKSFGQHVPRNYKIAQYLLSVTKPQEKIFVWGESSPIYALTKRLPPLKYTVDYHIKDFSTPKEILNKLSQNKPVFIVILPQSPEFPGFDTFLSKNYGLIEEIEGATIWKLLNPDVRVILAS